jgi:hypothetical protein
MKHILKLTALLVVLALFATPVLMGQAQYRVGYKIMTAKDGWTYYRFSGTFISATDTFYCPIASPLPFGVQDTIKFVANLQTAAYSATQDSIKVSLDYQWSSTDFLTASGQTEAAVGTRASLLYDSTAQANTLYKLKTVIVGQDVLNGGPAQPFSRFRVRGVAAATGGVANRIGVKWILDVIVPKKLPVVQ